MQRAPPKADEAAKYACRAWVKTGKCKNFADGKCPWAHLKKLRGGSHGSGGSPKKNSERGGGNAKARGGVTPGAGAYGQRGQCFSWMQTGMCAKGDDCRYEHSGAKSKKLLSLQLLPTLDPTITQGLDAQLSTYVVKKNLRNTFVRTPNRRELVEVTGAGGEAQR